MKGQDKMRVFEGNNNIEDILNALISRSIIRNSNHNNNNDNDCEEETEQSKIDITKLYSATSKIEGEFKYYKIDVIAPFAKADTFAVNINYNKDESQSKVTIEWNNEPCSVSENQNYTYENDSKIVLYIPGKISKKQCDLSQKGCFYTIRVQQNMNQKDNEFTLKLS